MKDYNGKAWKWAYRTSPKFQEIRLLDLCGIQDCVVKAKVMDLINLTLYCRVCLFLYSYFLM